MNKQLINKIFCEGTWGHKYDTAKNERIAEIMDCPNDRTSADVGEELEKVGFN